MPQSIAQYYEAEYAKAFDGVTYDHARDGKRSTDKTCETCEPEGAPMTDNELEAKLEADERDAERYRWIRKIGSKQMGVILDSFTSQALDDAIDAALASRPQLKDQP